MECRVDDTALREGLDKLLHADSFACAAAERQVLATLEAGCTAPVAAHATIADGTITLRAGVFALDGSKQLIEEASGKDARELGTQLAQTLIGRGAAEIMQ